MTEQAEDRLMPDGEDSFPVEDVEASIQDAELQRSNRVESLDDAYRDELEAIRRAAVADRGAPESARWVYFSSPDWTWQHLCGREGWLLYDRATQTQHAFLMTVMN
jgi:hypothetical protein